MRDLLGLQGVAGFGWGRPPATGGFKSLLGLFGVFGPGSRIAAKRGVHVRQLAQDGASLRHLLLYDSVLDRFDNASLFAGHVAVTATGAGPYAVGAADDLVLVAGTVATVNLPAGPASGARMITVKDSQGDAAASPIVVVAAPGETIDGAASKAINTNYGALTALWTGGGAWVSL